MHDRTRAALGLESRAIELGARKAELFRVNLSSVTALAQAATSGLERSSGSRLRW